MVGYCRHYFRYKCMNALKASNVERFLVGQ